MAFGTGSHSTTALCLKWLDENIQGDEIVIDYGCGSGILAVAALKLGAAFVTAIDHDPQALDACRMNALQNALSDVRLQVGGLETVIPPEQADVLIANILAKPLIDLAPQFASLVKRGGKLALSGILDTQRQDVMDAYQAWFTIDVWATDGEWVCLQGWKK